MNGVTQIKFLFIYVRVIRNKRTKGHNLSQFFVAKKLSWITGYGNKPNKLLGQLRYNSRLRRFVETISANIYSECAKCR